MQMGKNLLKEINKKIFKRQKKLNKKQQERKD